MRTSLGIALWGALVLLVPAAAALALTLALGRALPWQFDLPAVGLHVGAALAALALGVVQLASRKGDRRHRLLGYGWCGLIAVIAASGLAVDLEPGGAPTLIHQLSSVFSVATLALLPIVIHAGRTGRRVAHRNALAAIFGVMLLAGALSFLPQRALGLLIAAAVG